MSEQPQYPQENLSAQIREPTNSNPVGHNFNTPDMLTTAKTLPCRPETVQTITVMFHIECIQVIASTFVKGRLLGTGKPSATRVLLSSSVR